MIFGDSLSDQGRRFEAPASFEFEDIGVVPWKKIFAANDSEVRVLPVKNEIRGLKPKTGACYILHKAHTRNILVSIFRPSFSLSVQVVGSCGPSCFLLFSIVFFPFILDVEFVGRTSRGHTGGSLVRWTLDFGMDSQQVFGGFGSKDSRLRSFVLKLI